MSFGFCWGFRVWGGFSVVIQELLSLIDSKRKRYKLYSCFFLFSLWTKWPRMNVLQTPGFQYCVYFDGLSPALCNFRGLCVWLVSCDCALSRRNLQSPAYLDIHSYTSRLYRLCGPLGPNRPSKGRWGKKRSSKTSGPTIVLAPKLPKRSRYLVLFVFTWSSTQLKQLTTISSTIHWFPSGTMPVLTPPKEHLHDALLNWTLRICSVNFLHWKVRKLHQKSF